MSCEAIEQRLDELAFAHALDGPEPEVAAHLRDCAACRAHRGFLVALTTSLANATPAPVAAPVVAVATERALRVLRARPTQDRVGREIVAAIAVALLALPLVVAHAYLVVEAGAWLLARWVPAPLLVWLGGVYLLSLALGVGALYGLIPLAVAWRRRAGS